MFMRLETIDIWSLYDTMCVRYSTVNDESIIDVKI